VKNASGDVREWSGVSSERSGYVRDDLVWVLKDLVMWVMVWCEF